jgi:hypothetical protein
VRAYVVPVGSGCNSSEWAILGFQYGRRPSALHYTILDSRFYLLFGRYTPSQSPSSSPTGGENLNSSQRLMKSADGGSWPVIAITPSNFCSTRPAISLARWEEPLRTETYRDGRLELLVAV